MEGNLVKGILCGDGKHTPVKGVCRAGKPREGGQQGSSQNRGRASTRWVRFGLLPAPYARSPSPRCVWRFSQSQGIGGKAGGLPEGHQV